MIQFRFDLPAIKLLMSEFNMVWDYSGHTHSGIWWESANWEAQWDCNLTRVIDELNRWCKNQGITHYAVGFTQIELCITFGVKSEAMLFKLRWHHAQTA